VKFHTQQLTGLMMLHSILFHKMATATTVARMTLYVITVLGNSLKLSSQLN